MKIKNLNNRLMINRKNKKEGGIVYTIKLDSSDNELYHYGVAGQKWGIRKSRYRGSNKRKKRKLDEAKYLSTEELNKRTNRMRAERDYYQTKQNLEKYRPKSRKQKGKEFVIKVGSEVITQATINVGKQYLSKQLRKKLGM